VATALPVYVGEMDRYLKARDESDGDLTVALTATSPHILAKRARLGRVKMKELTIVASGRALDQDLAELCGARFHLDVGEAYAAGQAKLEALRAG
jgi:hypothetical protein